MGGRRVFLAQMFLPPGPTSAARITLLPAPAPPSRVSTLLGQPLLPVPSSCYSLSCITSTLFRDIFLIDVSTSSIFHEKKTFHLTPHVIPNFSPCSLRSQISPLSPTPAAPPAPGQLPWRRLSVPAPPALPASLGLEAGLFHSPQDPPSRKHSASPPPTESVDAVSPPSTAPRCPVPTGLCRLPTCLPTSFVPHTHSRSEGYFKQRHSRLQAWAAFLCS